MSEVWWQRLLLWGRGQTSEDEQDDCSRESCRVGYDVGGAMLMDGNHYRNPPFLGVGRRTQPRRKFYHKDKTEQEYWSSAMDTQCPSTLFTSRSLSKALLSRNLVWVVTNPPFLPS